MKMNDKLFVALFASAILFIAYDPPPDFGWSKFVLLGLVVLLFIASFLNTAQFVFLKNKAIWRLFRRKAREDSSSKRES
jgi:hypothetical protein